MIQSSFEKAKSWVKELQRQANPNIVIALVGNKVDLLGESSGSNADENDEDDDTATATPEAGDSSSLRAVPKDEVEAYAKEAGLLFFETSAKTGEGVVEVFTEIGEYNAPRESCCSPTIPGDAMVEPLSDPKLPLIGPNYSQEDPNRPSPRTQCCCGSYRRCCGTSGRRWPGRRCGPERQQPAATRCLQLLILARSLARSAFLPAIDGHPRCVQPVLFLFSPVPVAWIPVYIVAGLAFAPNSLPLLPF